MTQSEKSRPFDIRVRTFEFAVDVIGFAKTLIRDSDAPKPLVDQLIRSASSVGANLEEAFGGQSKADFIHKNTISLKEAREANYWLRLILATSRLTSPHRSQLAELEAESSEIARIVGKIIVNSKKSTDQGHS